MYQNILACTDGSPNAMVAVRYAVEFARRLGARLRLLHITDIRLLEGPMLADLTGALGAQPYTALVPRLQEIQAERATAILKAAAAIAAEQGVPCETKHATGGLVDVMLEHEQQADLVVLGQRGEHARWHSGHLGSSVERLVRASIRPCLVAPEGLRDIRRLLIAYDGSDESRKALHAGLQLAGAFGCQVVLLTVGHLPDATVAGRVLEQAKVEAANARLTAEARLAQGHPEAVILQTILDGDIDLVVMGAYGHTRIREFVLGSVTSQVIRKANVPVLLARG